MYKVKRKKNKLKNTWEWRVIELDLILSTSRKDVGRTVSTHSTKAEAQAAKAELTNTI